MEVSPTPVAPLDRLPSRSDSPPRADRLVRAFSAPGLESSWASGMAEASGLLAMALALATAAELELPAVLLEPVLPLEFGSSGFTEVPVLAVPEAAASSPRFAFCSSTLLGKEREKEEVVRLGREKKDLRFVGGKTGQALR